MIFFRLTATLNWVWPFLAWLATGGWHTHCTGSYTEMKPRITAQLALICSESDSKEVGHLPCYKALACLCCLDTHFRTLIEQIFHLMCKSVLRWTTSDKTAWHTHNISWFFGEWWELAPVCDGNPDTNAIPNVFYHLPFCNNQSNLKISTITWLM